SALLSAGSRAGRAPVRVHLFEPAPAAASELGRRFASHIEANVIIVNQVALSDIDGIGDLYMTGSTAGTNSLLQHHGVQIEKRVKVTLATLDSYCDLHGVQRIDLLKIDAEGHDLAVLRGGAKLLRNHSIDVVQFEYNWRWIDSRAFLKDAFDLLAPSGYGIGKVTPKGIE